MSRLSILVSLETTTLGLELNETTTEIEAENTTLLPIAPRFDDGNVTTEVPVNETTTESELETTTLGLELNETTTESELETTTLGLEINETTTEGELDQAARLFLCQMAKLRKK